MTQPHTPPHDERERQFVARVLEKCKKDAGFAARLRRADNPDTEYYALGDLCTLGINIEDDSERLPFALIACRDLPPLLKTQRAKTAGAVLAVLLILCWLAGDAPRLLIAAGLNPLEAL